jgi:hypothetical protein
LQALTLLFVIDGDETSQPIAPVDAWTAWAADRLAAGAFWSAFANVLLKPAFNGLKKLQRRSIN